MIRVASFYKFIKIDDCDETKNHLIKLLANLNIKGTIILAGEGINATIAGDDEAIISVKNFLDNDERFASLEHKESFCQHNPFNKLKIKIKPEIVTMGKPDLGFAHETGAYVSSAQWNEFILNDDVVVIDVRNDFEVTMGSFMRSINPYTKTFRDFPHFVKQNLNDKNKTIAMCCTGGIRCEKASAYLHKEGFNKVFQLKGGILRYLEEMPSKESLWQGQCFIFDHRIALDHSLAPIGKVLE